MGSTHRAARCRRGVEPSAVGESRDPRIERPAAALAEPVEACLPSLEHDQEPDQDDHRDQAAAAAPNPRGGWAEGDQGPDRPGPGRGRPPRSAPRSRPRAVRPQAPATSTASRRRGRHGGTASVATTKKVNSVSDISECSSTRASPLRSTTAGRDQAEPVRAGDPSHRPPREHGRPEGEQVLNRDRHRDLVAEHVASRRNPANTPAPAERSRTGRPAPARHRRWRRTGSASPAGMRAKARFAARAPPAASRGGPPGPGGGGALASSPAQPPPRPPRAAASGPCFPSPPVRWRTLMRPSSPFAPAPAPEAFPAGGRACGPSAVPGAHDRDNPRPCPRPPARRCRRAISRASVAPAAIRIERSRITRCCACSRRSCTGARRDRAPGDRRAGSVRGDPAIPRPAASARDLRVDGHRRALRPAGRGLRPVPAVRRRGLRPDPVHRGVPLPDRAGVRGEWSCAGCCARAAPWC